ncbi:hypothetical protein ABIB90_000524 [Bradyrhizobium sp. JR4.1]|uniref:hypothetical protein n=1 Tax=Bradyrhizobium sp. JR4.1 TaxID=3156372 RepID=UPI003396CFEB
MTPTETHAFSRLRSVMAALGTGPVLSAEDAAWLHAALRNWLESGTLEQATDQSQKFRNGTLEHAMDQPKQFRAKFRIADAVDLLAQRFETWTAAELESAIKRYHAGEYRIHKEHGTAPAGGDRAAFHQFLTATGGQLRDKRTIQRWREKTTPTPHVNVAPSDAICMHGKGTTDAKTAGSRSLRSDRGSPR